MKRLLTTLATILLISITLNAQQENVGIGTNTPEQSLHIKTTGIGIQNILLLDSEASSNIWLKSPFGQSKSLTFMEGESNVASIFWNDGRMKIFSDYSGLIPKPTLTLSEGYKLGINMGIFGDPDQKLTVNGKIRIGDDILSPTEGSIRYDTVSNSFQGYNGSGWGNFGGDWSKSVQTLYYDQGSVFIGRSSNIGFETFGIRYPVSTAQLGGMNVETFGHKWGKPFYGYAIDGASKMYHYFDGLSETWRLNYNGDRVIVNSNGNVGIGVTSPVSKLHIEGSNGSISESEGDFKIGSASHRLVMGVNTDGDFAGDARIYSKGGTKRLILGAETNDVMSITGDGFVGIGTIDPAYPLELVTSQQTGSKFTNSYSGSNTKYGLRVESTSSGLGTKYGIRGDATAHSVQNDSKHIYGVYGLANGNNSDANIYGIAGIATLSGDGNKYGVYAEAGTADPAQGKKSFALFAKGNSYFQNDVRIGSLEPVTGYKLIVDGKMISEELKVQLSDVWPDYVFDEEYQLMPLDELSRFLKEKKHLPGVPSANEVKEENGIHVGEMNRVLLEKIEELTLYIIKQQEEIEVLKKSVNGILNNPSKL